MSQSTRLAQKFGGTWGRTLLSTLILLVAGLLHQAAAEQGSAAPAATPAPANTEGHEQTQSPPTEQPDSLQTDTAAQLDAEKPVAPTIIDWPLVLRDARFADQRARVEAPYRREPKSVRTAADYSEMIDAAAQMREIVARHNAELPAYDALNAVRFLEQLAAEAHSRLESLQASSGPAATANRQEVVPASYNAPPASLHRLAQRESNAGQPEDNRVSALIAEIEEPQPKLDVEVHRSKLLRTKVPVTRISVTDPNVLDVVQYTPTEFELIGHRPGQTSLTFWYGDNQTLRYLVRVKVTSDVRHIENQYRELQDKVNELFPNSMIQLIPISDKLIVRGQARDSAEATQILSVLSSGGYGQAAGRGRTGVNGAGAYGGYGGIGRMLDIGAAAPPSIGSDVPAHNLINLLDVPGEQQVMLKVRVAELSRTALRNLTTSFRINSGILSMNTESGGLSAVFSSVLTPQDLRLAITAVSASGYAKVLAEPNLVTLNGQPASFLAGGEFPVPTAVGIGGVSGINTQFHSFGTQLTFTPTIIDKDRIRLVVAPSFSTVDPSLSVQGVPGTRNRAVSTQIDLRVGQWLAIAGLLQDQQNGNKSRVPFAGDIPVIGALFGQASSSREQTELIVLVSPELVHPLDAREVPLILPGMEIAEPSDAAFFLKGAYVGRYDDGVGPVHGCGRQCDPETRRQAMREAMSRPDYQRSENYYLYGAHGTSQ